MTKKILHVRCVNGYGGGPDKTVINSPRYYPEFGYSGLIAFLHPPGDPGIKEIRKRAEDAKCEALFIEDRGPSDFRILKKLVAIAKENKVDLWQSHDDKTNLLGLYVRRFHPMKLVSMGHGWGADLGLHPWKSRLYKSCSRFACRCYDGCIAVSEDIDSMFHSWGIPDCRRFFIPNAIDTDYFIRRHDQKKARELIGHESTAQFLIGALGRLAPEKGFDRLIRVVRMVRDSGTMLELWIAGEGSRRSELQSLIESLGLGNSVKLLGHQKDPRLFLECLDGFVLSSLAEGLPNVILEALSMETPVVATRVAGVPGVITHRKEGLLVDIDDVEGLAKSIQELELLRSLGFELAKNGRKRMVECFSFRERMRRVCEVYDTILQVK